MPVSDPIALHTIRSLPLDADFPLFRHYPAMKMGVRESVAFYARLLVPLAEEIIASEPETVEWVITAPPLYVIPSGANLVAWEVHRILAGRMPRIRMVDLRYTDANPLTGATAEYSRAGIDERIRNRQGLHEGKCAPRPDPADFEGRAVLFVNDINVTGTQQHFVQRTLEPLRPASLHWLYIVQVAPELGRSNPEVEYALNHLRHRSFEEFAEIVTSADIDFTTRCISRLLDYPLETLEPLLRALDEPRRKRLGQLMADEGAYRGEEHVAKLARFA